jgi:hypothetical protein
MTLVKNHDLNSTSKPILIKNNVNTSKFTISFWVYVNSWNSLVEKTLINVPGKYRIFLSTIAPILTIEIYTRNKVQNIIITNDFPIQKWSCISINVDNKFIDCYMEGKLLKSIELDSLISDASGNMMYIGDNYNSSSLYSHDIILNNIKRWTVSQSPQSIYTYYLRGHNSKSIYNKLQSYNVDITIMKNKIITNVLQLL